MVVSSVTPFHRGEALRVPAGLGGEPLPDRRVQALLLFAARMGEDGGVFLRARAQVQQQGGVAAVVEDHVGQAAVRPFENSVGVVPVFLQRFALVGEHRRAGGGDGRRGVVLGGIDVARGPAHFGAQRLQRLDQHRGLDGHVQRAGDARAFERLFRGVFLADRHQPRHLGFGDADFLASPVGLQNGGAFITRSFHARKKFVSAVADVLKTSQGMPAWRTLVMPSIRRNAPWQPNILTQSGVRAYINPRAVVSQFGCNNGLTPVHTMRNKKCT